MKTLFLLALLFSTSALADGSCREESLVHFFSLGQEISSELIGADDPCDQFGGNRVHTAKYDLYLYVNFNIAGNINLDELEAAYAAGPNPRMKLISLAVVSRDWIKNKYGEDRDAALSLSGDTLFISEKVLEENRFTQLMREFYRSSQNQ